MFDTTQICVEPFSGGIMIGVECVAVVNVAGALKRVCNQHNTFMPCISS